MEGAEQGRIPRNEYNNVEVLSEEMLPPGTVHLRCVSSHLKERGSSSTRQLNLPFCSYETHSNGGLFRLGK